MGETTPGLNIGSRGPNHGKVERVYCWQVRVTTNGRVTDNVQTLV